MKVAVRFNWRFWIVRGPLRVALPGGVVWWGLYVGPLHIMVRRG